MRFLDGKVSITFNYNTDFVEPNSIRDIGRRRQTTCIVREVVPGQNTEDGRKIAEATTYQSPRDSDCKFIARKFALSRALKATKFDKKQRATIWKEYLEKVAIPGQKKDENVV